jgi:hypothetical protein
MVRLEEVEDEAFTSDQAGPIEEEGDWDTDDGTRACEPCLFRTYH